MNQPILVNELIQNPSTEKIERIVWVDEDRFFAYVINIEGEKEFPYAVRVKELEEALESGTLTRVPPEKDPVVRLIHEDQISERDREIRDKRYAIIDFLTQPGHFPNIFDRAYRGPLLREAETKYKATWKTCRKFLRLWWQRGMTPSALLPDYYKCGVRPEGWDPGEHKKSGRKRKYRNNGMVVSNGIKAIIRLGIATYYLNEKKVTLYNAYLQTCKDFFHQTVRYDGNGVPKPILNEEEEIISFDQFRYVYEQDRKLSVEIRKRFGKRERDLNHQPALGTSQPLDIGPGSVFQIDATVADVFLVSQYNRKWVIGRPVVYLIKDVMSRMIVGLYVGLEGPSWQGAMMALLNMASDKVKFCAEYGVEIEEKDFPCHHIPATIWADNGELKSKKAEPFILNLLTKIGHARPFQGREKGIIESTFKIYQGVVKPFVPGYINIDYKKRGGHDYRFDAKWTLREFTRVVIKMVLTYNNHLTLDNYRLDPDMAYDQINPIPIELWNWGIKRRVSTSLRVMPENIVKLNLLPRKNVSTSINGIKFKEDVFYTCNTASREEWFETGSRFKKRPLQVAYDPRDMSHIYIPSKDGRTFEKCWLTPKSERYKGLTLEDIDYYLEAERQLRDEKKHERLQHEVDLIAEIENEAEAAEREFKKQVDKAEQMAPDRVKDIKDHRKTERDTIRKKEAFKLGEPEKIYGKPAQVIPMPLPAREPEVDEDDEEDDDLTLFRNIQKEKLHGTD